MLPDHLKVHALTCLADNGYCQTGAWVSYSRASDGEMSLKANLVFLQPNTFIQR